MIVLKTKSPLKRVFIKGGPETSGPKDMPIEELQTASEVGIVEDDSLIAEQVEKMVGERVNAIRAEWEEEKERKIREEFEKGKKEGLDQAHQEIAERAKELASVIAALKEARENILREAEKNMVDMVLAIARKFVDSASVLGNDLIKQTIKTAVKMVTEKDKVVIRVNPDDLEAVRAHQDDIIYIGDGIGKLEIRQDKSIDRGGCVVETEAGNIDARIESRFAELEKALRQVYGNGNVEPAAGGPGAR